MSSVTEVADSSLEYLLAEIVSSYMPAAVGLSSAEQVAAVQKLEAVGFQIGYRWVER